MCCLEIRVQKPAVVTSVYMQKDRTVCITLILIEASEERPSVLPVLRATLQNTAYFRIVV